MHIKYLQISKLDANCLQILIFHKLKPSTHRQHRQGRDWVSLSVRVHVQFSVQQEARDRRWGAGTEVPAERHKKLAMTLVRRADSWTLDEAGWLGWKLLAWPRPNADVVVIALVVLQLQLPTGDGKGEGEAEDDAGDDNFCETKWLWQTP